MSRRAQAARRVLGWLRQGALLALWALVGWGTLLLLASAAGAVRDGPGVAFDRLFPGSDPGPWGWLNGASAALAVAAWVCLAGLLVLARMTQAEDDPPDDPEQSPRPEPEDPERPGEQSLDPERLPDEPT